MFSRHLSVLALLSMAFVSSAQAWVPPSFFAIRMQARKHGSFDSGVFKHKVTVYRSNGDVLTVLRETLSVNNVDRANVSLTDESGAVLATFQRKLAGVRQGETDRPVLYDFFFIKDAASIFEHFKTLGLPLKTENELYSDRQGATPYKTEPKVSFVPYEGRLALRIGEGAKSAQLWLEKEDQATQKTAYLPVKAVFPAPPESGVASESLEYRIQDYHQYKDFFYPKKVQVLRDGTIWIKIETQEVKLGSVVTEGLSAETAPVITASSGSVKEFLETYLKWIR